MRRLAAAIGVAVATVALLGWWALAVQRGDLGYVALRDAPDGTERTLSLFEVRAVHDDHYVLARGSLAFTVRGEPEGLVPGQEWTVGGVFEGGELVEAWRVPAPGRRGKKLLGLLGLGLAGVVGAAGVTFRADGLQIRG